ncbi:hypothetical protein [Spirosoma sp. KUDC1026]|uniref:hypothetical protein n=1 Tax=Spirosoma sp. KUDC1026 TaxID=2745947 RepID=UPI00159BC56E|nr:hypothetical protein [Spirosoma sp. KUDC1026]QKZ11160.1 hypothetical protein HU175_00290 [Spirosoma sp. KUDC1026]
MKRILPFAVLLAMCVACHKDTSVGPANLLFQRWQLLQRKRIGDTAWMVYNTDGVYDTEYRQDGTLVYRRDGVIQSGQCCRGNLFRRDGAKIIYSDFTSCPTVFCASVQSVVIQQLTDNLLELNDGAYIIQYQSVR